jgi:hypothetical protein
MEVYFNSRDSIITITYHGPVSRKYQFETAKEAATAYLKILTKLGNGGAM